MRPEETHFVQEVHVDMRASACRLWCDRCGSNELVLLDAAEFDDYVRRFLRTHPTACIPQPRDGSEA
jgi:hypothetical protein